MSNQTQQGFPSTNLPLVDTDRFITQNWYQMLVSLWNRTGGTMGSQTFVTGDIKISASSSLQDGWLPCDGSPISRTVYRSLFTALGTAWGIGDGTTTFNLPNFNGAFPMGGSDVGNTGGADTATLLLANLAPHNHPIIDPGHLHTITDPGHDHSITDPQHSHGYATFIADPVAGTGTNSVADNSVGSTTDPASTGITVDNDITNITINTNTTGITTGNTGSATPFSILNPYGIVNYMIKI